MSLIDQFESVFRSAEKDVYTHQPLRFTSAMLVSDLDEPEATTFLLRVKGLLSHVLHASAAWSTVSGLESASSSRLLAKVDAVRPDLICTYRNLHSDAWRFPHSLGESLDVLLQRTTIPVLVLPHPEAGKALEHAWEGLSTVMAVTDHLASDHNLVDHAVHFADTGGSLLLAHIEDQRQFDRVIGAISKIPSIDTEEAREKLARQLLKDPSDYAVACRRVLEQRGLPLTLKTFIQFGSPLTTYREAVEAYKLDLLVLNTKDDAQLAMHGLAYPLAVELRQIPLLML